MLVTHGYYYDRESGHATWRSDSWALRAEAPYNWRMLAPNLAQEDAYAAYSQGAMPAAPCGRFGHATAMAGRHLYMHGGHDGGVSRHNRQNYEPGYDFDELWRFDVTARAWQYLPPLDGAPTPGKRYLAAMAAVGDSLYVYGGMQADQGDVWSYHIPSNKWTRLLGEVPTAAGGPGRRVGHQMVAWTEPGGPRGIVLYGGRTVEADGSSALQGDAWFLDVSAKAWRQLKAAAGGATPPARKYHALMDTYLPVGTDGEVVHVGLTAGGTWTTPGLKCANDSWAFTLDCGAAHIAWTRLPDTPAALYDIAGAAWNTSAFLYGGHLCKLEPGDTRYPYYYTNEVIRLDLSAFFSKAKPPAKGAACALRASTLPPLQVEQLGGGDEVYEL